MAVYLGLGTNLGDREANLRRALEHIAAVATIDAVSSVYQSEPVGFADQPDFWNMVARVRTDLPARELMEALIAIEQDMGRERSFRNAPRLIDIDILLYDDIVFTGEDLVIPHPRMRERGFVLQPLVEIDPDVVDPATGDRYADLLSAGGLERIEVVAGPVRVGEP